MGNYFKFFESRPPNFFFIKLFTINLQYEYLSPIILFLKINVYLPSFICLCILSSLAKGHTCMYAFSLSPRISGKSMSKRSYDSKNTRPKCQQNYNCPHLSMKRYQAHPVPNVCYFKCFFLLQLHSRKTRIPRNGEQIKEIGFRRHR